MKDNYLVQAWLVLTLAVGFGAALAGVQVALQPRIEANKLAETHNQIPKLVPGADKAATIELQTPDERIAYKAFDATGAHVGWVIRASGQGFADKIELLIGLDAGCERILGLYVLDQKETPALGNRIVEGPWRAQFAGLSAADGVSVVKPPTEPAGNEVQAVTGATVSSRSVADIVNQATRAFRRDMGELKQAEPKEKD